MNIDDWRYAKDKYTTYQAAIRARLPEALDDPIIALAVAQIEMAYLAIDGRMAQLAEQEEDDQ